MNAPARRADDQGAPERPADSGPETARLAVVWAWTSLVARGMDSTGTTIRLAALMLTTAVCVIMVLSLVVLLGVHLLVL